MYGRSDDELREFWTNVQDMWLSLYTAPIPVIAAINGAAPAGGCLMAMSCDYRIMAQHPKPGDLIFRLSRIFFTLLIYGAF